jgi:hypothetical protein
VVAIHDEATNVAECLEGTDTRRVKATEEKIKMIPRNTEMPRILASRGLELQVRTDHVDAYAGRSALPACLRPGSDIA